MIISSHAKYARSGFITGFATGLVPWVLAVKSLRKQLSDLNEPRRVNFSRVFFCLGV